VASNFELSMDENSFLALTSKGAEELQSRIYKLDFKARNILFLIKMGSLTLEALAEKAVFPRSEVSAKLRTLLDEQFVTDGADSPKGVEKAASHAGGESLQLEGNVAISQAQFALSDFCLDCFGLKAQALIDAIARCNSVEKLQIVLDSIIGTVRKEYPERYSALTMCIQDINTSFS